MAGIGTSFKGFHRNFWLINLIELIERGAYYGMVSIYVFHFASQQGLSTAFVGMTLSLLVFFAYFFPVVAAALAEKYGFRPSLIVAFALVLLGYLGLGFTGALATLGDAALLPGILLLGLGAGLFKPIATAVIAQSTTADQRTFGFSIYYAGINIGGFLGPLLIGVLVPEALYGTVFVGAAAFAALNLVIIALTYRDVNPPQREKTVSQALARLAGIRKDPWFALLLLSYSGIWMMYAQQLYFAPTYRDDFVTGLPDWFTVPLVATINPGVIILAGPLLGKALTRYPSLAVVIGGILLYVLGMVLMGAGSLWSVFFLGIIVTSVAEVIAQPNFLSYVSKIAPKDQVAVYLGFGFLPVGLGLMVGSALGGVLYAQYAETLRTPGIYWAATAAIGAVSLAGMLIVNRRMAARQKDAVALTGPTGRALRSRAAPIAVLVLVPLVLLAGAVPGAQPFFREGSEGPGAPGAGFRAVDLDPVQGQVAEGQAEEVTIGVSEDQPRNVTFTLTWSDEAPATGPLPGVTNQPDTFHLEVATPDGRSLTSAEASNAAGGEGRLVFEVPNLDTGRAARGTYVVSVVLDSAGDNVVGPGLPATQDAGNAFTLASSFLVPA